MEDAEEAENNLGLDDIPQGFRQWNGSLLAGRG